MALTKTTSKRPAAAVTLVGLVLGVGLVWALCLILPIEEMPAGDAALAPAVSTNRAVSGGCCGEVAARYDSRAYVPPKPPAELLQRIENLSDVLGEGFALAPENVTEENVVKWEELAARESLHTMPKPYLLHPPRQQQPQLSYQ